MSGNGVDIAAVYQLLSQVADTVLRHDRMLLELRRDMDEVKQRMATKEDLKGLATKQDLAEVREALNFYHSAVVGHGIQLTELDTRLRRVEERLGMGSYA